MNSQDLKKFNLPDAPGVYFFLGKSRKILYIGKATSLKDRVKSYFVSDILMTRSLLIAKMLEEAEKVEFIETDSVLEALLLEASEIKKHQPIFSQSITPKRRMIRAITTLLSPKKIIRRFL